MAKEADNVAEGDDPFNRALAREQAYRERRSRSDMFGFPSALFGTFRWVAIGFVVAWGGLLAVHWSLLGDPRWLAVLHTMVYGVICLYFAAIAIMFTVIRKKPAAFGLTSEDD
ncbi:MAG: hypothetical protein KY395_03055 [Actinobacteria bacterium]|nr:hypothetical protein [Actinomycetota bacterium]